MNSRELIFPENRSIGLVFIWSGEEATGQPIRRVRGGWKRRVEARGTIQVASEDKVELWYKAGEVADLSLLSSFRSDDLYRLGLQFCNIRDDDLKWIAHLTDLKVLDLTDVPIVGSGLRSLAGMSSLRMLYMPYTKVSDIGLPHLAPLVRLEELDLTYAFITDTGLMSLQPLTNLRSLNLNSTAITDKGLVPLEGMSQLRKLYLGHSQVSEDGVNRLRQRLPQCEIVTE